MLAVAGAVACSAYALVVVGRRVLNPLDLAWFEGDSAINYIGWAFFRQETHLTLPLGWSHSLGYPLGQAVAYSDAMPIVAVIAWFVNLFVKSEFQYFGLYFLACCILQFYFGYRISVRIFSGNRLAGIFGAALFLSAPPFNARAFDHFQLVSHWIILAALDQLMTGANPPSRRQAAWRGILCFIAAGVNPYIAVMTLLIILATYTRPMLVSRGSIVTCLAGMGLSILCVAGSLALFGFLRSPDITQYAGAGYDFYSMNLLAPIDPAPGGSLLLKQQPIFPGQYEGLNYLGLGVLLLGLVSIARTPSCLRDLFLRTSVPAIGVTVISLLLAISNKITFGHYVLFQVPLPSPIMSVLDAFHTSGRLFWPGYYLLFIGVLTAASRSFGATGLGIALGVTVIIQFADIAPLLTSIRSHRQSQSAAPAPSGPEWDKLGQRQRHLGVLPAYQCGVPPENKKDWWIFGKLALEQQMTVNTAIAARYSQKQGRYFCFDQVDEIRQFGLRPDTVYVLHKELTGLVRGLETRGNFCRFVNSDILCSRVDGRSGVDPDVFSSLPILRPGDTVSFAAGLSLLPDSIARSGWSVPEPWGRWAQGHLAMLAFKLPLAPQRDITLDISMRAFVSSSNPRQRVEILANSQPVAQHTFEQAEITDLRVVVPKRMVEDDQVVRLELRLPDAISPAAVGLSGDQRDLSVGLVRLRVNASN